METMRSTWTDERLDDLSKKVDDGFDRVDRRFDKVDARLETLDARLDGIQRTMIQSSVGMTAAIVTALLATQL
jgi:tetrahydromethanopterin S-methyltransferase subunit G